MCVHAHCFFPVFFCVCLTSLYLTLISIYSNELKFFCKNKCRFKKVEILFLNNNAIATQMVRRYGLAQEGTSVTGIWELCLTSVPLPMLVPLPALPCWPHRVALASVGAEVILQRSHGNNSSTWLGRGKGQTRRQIWDGSFSQGQGKESTVLMETKTHRGQDLIQGHSAVSGRGSLILTKCGRDNKMGQHYRELLIRNCTLGGFILEIDWFMGEMMSVWLDLT